MRITGGALRSRVLVAPRGDETRPTSDRVREALFSILGSQRTFEGARVLDLYAGTGALGLEALSRGAARVTFVERRREALSALRTNVNALGVGDRTRVVARSVESASGDLDGPFAFVFADPPYADVQSGDAQRALARILRTAALAEGGVLVLEHSSKTKPPALEIVGQPSDTRIYGDTSVSFYGGRES